MGQFDPLAWTAGSRGSIKIKGHFLPLDFGENV
jgi:hypothetical protein